MAAGGPGISPKSQLNRQKAGEPTWPAAVLYAVSALRLKKVLVPFSLLDYKALRSPTPFKEFLMTKILFALFLLATPTAFAGIDDMDDVGYAEMRYLSWCVGNSVMEEGSRGLSVLKTDCAAHRLACKQEERIVGRGRVVFASCQAPRR